jgi:hypothetical protein
MQLIGPNRDLPAFFAFPLLDRLGLEDGGNALFVFNESH